MNQQVAEAFKKLYNEKRTGVLTCEAAAARRAVYFQSGFVVSASSSEEEDRLGEVMIRHGRITRRQFEDASNFIKSGWKLGEILAELNIIEEPDIEAFVRLQLLDIACTQLITPPGRMAFSPLSSVDACLEAPLSVADVLMEAVRRTPDISEQLEALKSDERTLGFPADPLRRFQRIHLEPDEGFVLSRIDGTQAPKDIFAVSPLSEEKTARTLMGLLAAEIIEVEGNAIVEPVPDDDDPDTGQTLHQDAPMDLERASVEELFKDMKDQDHWQVLGIERGASAEQIKQGFFRGAKRFHPDRFRRITEPEFQERLSFIFHRINEAHETLSNDESRADYESLCDKEEQYRRSQQPGASLAEIKSVKRGDPGDAKVFHQRAKRAYDSHDFWGAIELARQAVDAAPDVAAYYHLLGMALSKNPKWRQDAEKNLKIATHLDAFNASYQLELAKLYEEAGLHLRAQKTLEKARAIDPSLNASE
ncbi:MAG: J domain-containing protein [Acidobacteria bacterium]|nr:MAG: J domain-containing protein [Acidobacteriota bacterium]